MSSRDLLAGALRAGALLGAPLLGALLAGGCALPTPLGRCAHDLTACERVATDEVPTPTCAAPTTVSVTLGQGIDAVAPIDGGLDIHYGQQGGSHLFLGVRVALETPEPLWVRFTVWPPEADYQCALDLPGAGTCEYTLGQRAVRLDAADLTAASGGVEAPGHLVTLDFESYPATVLVEVVGECVTGWAHWRRP